MWFFSDTFLLRNFWFWCLASKYWYWYSLSDLPFLECIWVMVVFHFLLCCFFCYLSSKSFELQQLLYLKKVFLQESLLLRFHRRKLKKVVKVWTVIVFGRIPFQDTLIFEDLKWTKSLEVWLSLAFVVGGFFLMMMCCFQSHL